MHRFEHEWGYYVRGVRESEKEWCLFVHSNVYDCLRVFFFFFFFEILSGVRISSLGLIGSYKILHWQC